ncbi:MAG: hypothetical protein H7281_09355 [Bacteriovorax sp.]|nr:hypothetical protein [Bacteriovorax sp.]
MKLKGLIVRENPIKLKTFKVKKMKYKLNYLIILLTLIVCVSCAESSIKMNSLKTGMSKDEFFSVMGKPSETGARGNMVVYTYFLHPNDTLPLTRVDAYFFAFNDEVLVEFGQHTFQRQ